MGRTGTAVLALTIVAAFGAPAPAEQEKKKPKIALPADSLYLLKCKSLEGTDVDLRDYAGTVALIVNLASQ